MQHSSQPLAAPHTTGRDSSSPRAAAWLAAGTPNTPPAFSAGPTNSIGSASGCCEHALPYLRYSVSRRARATQAA